MKYIIFEDFGGEATPVIFPRRIDFEEMREQVPYTKVLSAGMVSLEQGLIKCQGRSVELGLGSLDGDSRIITKHLA